MGILNALPQAFGALQRFQRIGAAQQDSEFFAAVTHRQVIGSQIFAEQLGVTVENGINCTLSPNFERERPDFLPPGAAKWGIPQLAHYATGSQKQKLRCDLAGLY